MKRKYYYLSEGRHVARCNEDKGMVTAEILRDGKWKPYPLADLWWGGKPISEEEAMKMIRGESI